MALIKSETGEKLNIQTAGIFYNKENSKAVLLAKEVTNVLNLKDINTKVNTTDEFRSDITFGIILGGDGTILKAARYFAHYDIPIMGINLGRLGFLAQSKPEQIREVFANILNGQFRIEERMMISSYSEKLLALNDIVIKGDGFSRTSRMYVRINDKTVCDYLADGVIISTPTGSTAYNLSAGGPVLFPTLNAMVIVPICPHTMNARPIVVPSNEIITITSSQDKPLMRISADGQNTYNINPNEEVRIEKSKYKAKLLLVNVKNNSFYTVLKEKLNWGLSWRE